MKVAMGMLLVGKLTDIGASKVFAVKSMSVLKSGDRKVWLVNWEPQSEGDGLVTEASVRFPDGEVVEPWHVLDVYDSGAMLDRIEQSLRVQLAGGHNFRKLALSAASALFKGPSKGV